MSPRCQHPSHEETFGPGNQKCVRYNGVAKMYMCCDCLNNWTIAFLVDDDYYTASADFRECWST